MRPQPFPPLESDGLVGTHPCCDDDNGVRQRGAYKCEQNHWAGQMMRWGAGILSMDRVPLRVEFSECPTSVHKAILTRLCFPSRVYPHPRSTSS